MLTHLLTVLTDLPAFLPAWLEWPVAVLGLAYPYFDRWLTHLERISGSPRGRDDDPRV